MVLFVFPCLAVVQKYDSRWPDHETVYKFWLAKRSLCGNLCTHEGTLLKHNLIGDTRTSKVTINQLRAKGGTTMPCEREANYGCR